MSDNLEELQKKLYTPDRPTVPESASEVLPEEPPVALPPPGDIEPSGAIWQRITIGVAVFIILATGLAAFVFFRGFYSFRKDKVELKLSGPQTIAAGETAVWRVAVVNKNETELRDGELTFQFPDFSRPVVSDGESSQFKTNALKQSIPIPELGPGGLFEREFKAVMFGGENFERKAQAVFKFKPSSGNVVFESLATMAVRILSFPVDLTVEAAKETIAGETLEVTFRLSNNSDAQFDNIRVRLEYPSGFRPEEASEKLFEFNNVWRVDGVLPKETRTLTIRGSVSGLEGEGKFFRAFVEGLEGSVWKVYKEAGGQVRLITPPLSLYLNTDPDGISAARRGESVFYKFVWQNNLDIPLANLTLKVVFGGDGFDFSSLEVGGDGSVFAKATNFDAAAKTLTLNRDNFAPFFGLQPLERGELTIKIKVKDTAAGGSKLSVTAVIESTTKPEGLAVSKISTSQSLTLGVGD